MIELPDGKISRTLPEQVGYLSKQVQRIFRFLDGINVQDNVVVVDNIATPLTAEELVIVNRDVAFLVYSGQLYIKKSVSGSTAYFDVVFSISAGTTITFNSSEIQVNLSNGGMSLVSNSPATYSEAQIDTLLSAKADITYVDAQLALKANLAGANFTGAITAPSIVENMTGYSFVKNTNLLWTPDYVGAVKNGNKLTLVIFGSYTYQTGDTTQYLGSFVVPSEVYAKLYPYSLSGYTDILTEINGSLYVDIDTIKPIVIPVRKTGGQAVTFVLRRPESAGLTNGSTYTFRFEVTFLLSNNLAS